MSEKHLLIHICQKSDMHAVGTHFLEFKPS